MKNYFDNAAPLFIGLDVGSTTVKAVVMDAKDRILWKDYRRHMTKQSETVFEFLTKIEGQFPGKSFQVFTTGNGGRALGPLFNGIQIQEVNAVTAAVEKRFPSVGSVVELGGQDAKIIIWKQDGEGNKNAVSFMNDKCAGGTGATLDKIFAKIGLSPKAVENLDGMETPIHNIAAKCGVFAETDVVGLVKAGINPDEIAVSLINAVIKQNIEVLLHGNALLPDVLLLGGPHFYYKAFETLWRRQIPAIWKLHRFSPPRKPIEEMIYVPNEARYFAAMGAVYFGRESEHFLFEHRGDDHAHRPYEGCDALIRHIESGKTAALETAGEKRSALVASDAEKDAFSARFGGPAPSPSPLPRDCVVDCFLGVDGGSTSTKLVLLDREGAVLYQDYTLSKGNPIVDLKEMFRSLETVRKQHRLTFNILSTGVTGYASEILKRAFAFDIAVVETVAHLKSAQQLYGDVDVICDVGGQDIKVLFMKHNRVVDIKLNTQCSAGNGYFLQSMAEQFGIPIECFADAAFSVRKAPSFNYGCAVFMEQDKVNFQQLGWTKEEIMAGLALVLPLNIWNYVVQETNLAALGRRFLLQGGTQKNLAAVKAQVDFIESKVQGAEVMVHRHADIAGAIGAALESASAVRVALPTRQRDADAPDAAKSTFIGLAAGTQISFASKNDASTVCTLCSNRCKRTFIDIRVPQKSPVRHISGYGCDKGQFEGLAALKEHRIEAAAYAAVPNLVADAAETVFATYALEERPKHLSDETARGRSQMVVGLPRLLNMFFYAPFFSTYFRALGVGKVVYSDFTNEKLWSEGNKWGAIDPCFPAKVAPAHIFQLLKNESVTHICFPMITHLETMVKDTLGENACVIQMGTPEVTHAAFTKDRNHFHDFGKIYFKPMVRLDRPKEAQGRLLDYFGKRLGVTPEENEWAVAEGYRAMSVYLAELRAKGAEVIHRLVEEDRIGILFLGHPYHHDPGLNHGILEAFRKRGYPVLPIEALPISRRFLDPLFPEGESASASIADVWQRGFNRNTNAKVWAAKVASRHPNLAVIDMSSFKCGHDAPTYSYIDKILDASSTPHFLFHDIDQNKPSSTLNIRIESIDYFLKKEQERLREKIRELAG